MAKHTVDESLGDGAPSAPRTAQPIQYAPQKRMERRGQVSAPMAGRYPTIRGGVCEFCGTLDSHMPSEVQYKLCPHFRGLGDIRCTYCPETKDPIQVIGHAVVNVSESPFNPNEVIAWCDSFECSKAHMERFSRAVR